MSDNGKHSWLSSLGSVVAILTVVVNGMGFLTIQTFILRMCLPTNFFEDTPVDYFQWGAKAVVALIVITISMAILISLAVAIVSVIFRLTVFRFKYVKGLLERVVQGLRTRIQRMSPARLTGFLFLASFIIFFVYGSAQSPIILGFMDYPDCQLEKFDAPIVFSSSNEHSLGNYRTFSAFLIIILTLALFLSNKILVRAVSQKIFPNLFTAGILSLLLFALALWAMPYRLMSHNEFEAVRYGNEQAYVISEKNSRLFLYVPGKRPFVIDEKDTLLDRTGKRYYENIFDKTDTLLERTGKRYYQNKSVN